MTSGLFPVFYGLVSDQPNSNLAWEIIIVDDASPDGTQEVAKQLQKVYGEDHIVSVKLFWGHVLTIRS